VSDTLVLGLGNTLRGDDGLGPEVIRWLRDQTLPPHVVIQDGGTPGLELVVTLSAYQRALIIDAADIGRAPGEWVRLSVAQARASRPEAELSLHSAGLAEALALGQVMGKLPESLVIFGVQPRQIDWSIGLSAVVQEAVPAIGRAVLSELGACNTLPAQGRV
jgi:hydrogenase maturation protease